MLRRQVKQLIKKASENNYQTLNIIEVNKSHLLHNVDLIKNQHPSFGIIPVLKANAYGHGLDQVAEILNTADCDFLAVDGYFEAAKIRDITRHKILVLGYIKPQNAELLDIKKCSFVVQDTDMLKSLAKLEKPVNIHIELNTGMNRLGLRPQELESYLEVLRNCDNLKLEGVMTHLADADNGLSDDVTIKQTKLFDNQVKLISDKGFKPKYLHIAQTAGSTKADSRYANSMRIGIGTYGVNPLSPGDKHYKDLDKLIPVLELKSTVIKIINLKRGDRVSYNGIFTAPKAMTIGVLPLGYYEGVPRQLSDKGWVTTGDRALPIIGRICMNHTMIDLKDSKLGVGDSVTVISSDRSLPNSIEQISRSFNLFSYSLMTGLSSSTRRQIV